MPYIGKIDEPSCFLNIVEEDEYVYHAEWMTYLSFLELNRNIFDPLEMSRLLDSIHPVKLGLCFEQPGNIIGFANKQSNLLGLYPNRWFHKRLGIHSMSLFVAMHEMSHIVADQGIVTHDENFRNVHLNLVKEYISNEFSKALKLSYERHIGLLQRKYSAQFKYAGQ